MNREDYKKEYIEELKNRVLEILIKQTKFQAVKMIREEQSGFSLRDAYDFVTEIESEV